MRKGRGLVQATVDLAVIADQQLAPFLAEQHRAPGGTSRLLVRFSSHSSSIASTLPALPGQTELQHLDQQRRELA